MSKNYPNKKSNNYNNNKLVETDNNYHNKPFESYNDSNFSNQYSKGNKNVKKGYDNFNKLNNSKKTHNDQHTVVERSENSKYNNTYENQNVEERKEPEENEISETLIIFPGEKYPFNQELLTQGNFFLESQKNFNNENENPLKENDDKKFLVSKNFFSLSVCNEDKVKFNMASQLQGKYYNPKNDDMIIGTILQKTMEQYKLDINSYSQAILGTSEFEGASKKTKPNLKVGDTVFCKVLKVNKFDSPLLTCISGDGKSWSSGEAFFGALTEGHIYKIPLNLVNIYFYFGEVLFNRIEDAIEYEYNLGHNGVMRIHCEDKTQIPKIKLIISSWGKMILKLMSKGASITKENSWNSSLEKMLNKFFMTVEERN